MPSADRGDRRTDLLLLQCAQRSPRRGGQVPGGASALGEDHARALRGPARAGDAVTVPRPDRWFDAYRAAAGEHIARVAHAGADAVLGGAQSLHTNSMDEALGLPTESAATTALRTQQILAFESGAANTVDPLGGAYAIEALTTRIESGAFEYLNAIDARGGTVSCIEAGYQQREIQEAAYRHQQELESGSRVIVGVNRYLDEAAAAGRAAVPIRGSSRGWRPINGRACGKSKRAGMRRRRTARSRRSIGRPGGATT